MSGVPYRVVAEPRLAEELVTEVSGTLAVDGATVAFLPVSATVAELNAAIWVDDRYLLPVGPWIVEVLVTDVMADRIGRDARSLVEAIDGRLISGIPTLLLPDSIRWAADLEAPQPLETTYTTFTVRRGCHEVAATCTDTRALQVIPLDRLEASAPTFPNVNVWLEASEPRLIEDVSYLDPGPLGPRGGHSVLWSGSEMIVWGGATGDRPPHLVEGAAFDPASNSWRLLPPGPFNGPEHTTAVWGDDRMIVVGRTLTATYDPSTDVWETIGEGISLPLDPSLTVWTGSTVASWGPSGISLFEDGGWTTLPHPGFGGPERYRGALLMASDRLVAAGLASGVCTGRRLAMWTGAEWRDLPTVDLSTDTYADCGTADQIGVWGDRIVAWESREHPTKAVDWATMSWTVIDRIPLPGAEGTSGWLRLDDRLLVPLWGMGAVLGPDGVWRSVELPGQGSGWDMVWTGSEVLMWGATCCYGAGNTPFRIDAWRWRP